MSKENKFEKNSQQTQQFSDVNQHSNDTGFQVKRTLFFLKLAILSGSVKKRSLLNDLRKKQARFLTDLRMKQSEKK